MGDPRRLKKKYKNPIHPWQKSRMDDESILTKEFGLKNKRELWKMDSVARRFTESAKRLIRTSNPQSEKERNQLIEKIYNMGLAPAKNVPLDNALGLTVRNILERRLQTLVYRKGIANTIKKARQFITHGHIMVGTTVITSPSHIITRSEEEKIMIVPDSKLSNAEHPERVVKQKEKKETEKYTKNRSRRK